MPIAEVTNPLIILDRDGVINYNREDYVTCAEQWHAIPGSLQAIKLLSNANYIVTVATNQAGIAKGLYTEADLNAIHLKMVTEVHAAGGDIAHIEYCPHRDEDSCGCRKPQPGMLLKILEKFQVEDMSQIVYVGDKYSDLEAAQNAGIQGVLVKSGYGEQTLVKHPDLQQAVYSDLLEYARVLLRKPP